MAAEKRHNADMSLDHEVKVKGGVKQFYVFDEETPDKKELAYEIDTRNSVVTFYPRDASYPLEAIVFEGFDRKPDVLHENGYLNSGITYQLGQKLSETRVSKLTVLKDAAAMIRKKGDGHTMVLPYEELERLGDRFRAVNSQATMDKKIAAAEMFSAAFPRKYNPLEASDNVRFSRLIANLDGAMIATMSPEQVDQLLDFAAKVISEKYTQTHHREKLFKAAKLKFDTVALDEVIEKFEKMLAGSHSEADWGKFLKSNLYLVESRYVEILPELNLMLGGNRKVDFGLIDTHGFLDLFEIKKPDTQLLAAGTDRGNWYWSTPAIKAITQAEKYLSNAERKGAQLAEDIKREYGISLQVNKPRAVLIMGSDAQIVGEPTQVTDFRILCSSLKNVEVVTYDELLVRLKNQRAKSLIQNSGQ